MNSDIHYTRFYIVRHGQSAANVKGVYSGHGDAPLTEEGRQQAKKRAETLRHIRFDFAFSSDLIRAKHTAEIIAMEHKLAVKTTEVLRERNFGSLEGSSEQDISAREELKRAFEKFKTLSASEKYRYKYVPDMESDEELSLRLLTFLREAAVAYPRKTILIACHGGIMRTFLMRIGYGTADELPAGCVENTGYIKLRSDGVDFFVDETEGIHKNKS